MNINIFKTNHSNTPQFQARALRPAKESITLLIGVNNLCKRFNSDVFTPEKVLETMQKSNSIPVLTPENIDKIEKRVRGLADRFKDEGWTLDDCLMLALRNSSVLATDDALMERNVRGVVEKFKQYGLKTATYLSVIKTQQPSLISSSPDTIEKTVNNIYNEFKSYGVTIEMLVNSIEKNGIFLALSSKTIISKIKNMLSLMSGKNSSPEKLLKTIINNLRSCLFSKEKVQENSSKLLEQYAPEGLTKEKLANLYQKQYSLFKLSLEKIIKKIEFLKYLEKNKSLDDKKALPEAEELLDKVLKKRFTNSHETDCLIYLARKLSKLTGETIHQRNLKNSMQDFMQRHKDETFELTMLDDMLAKDFIETVSEYSEKTAGRNIFKFNLIS